MMSVLTPKIMGANTITVVAVPAMTARPTSLTPLIVALTGSSVPSARSRKILSVITTELSTSIPTASIRPIMDSMFSERPKKYSAPSVISIENGTDAITIRVVDICRKNRYRTMIASRPPTIPALSRSDRESLTLSPWLSSEKMLMPCICGNLPIFSTSAMTRSVTSTRFEPVVLLTATPMA